MYTPRVLYDVYDGKKKVLHLVTTKAVTTGYLIHGRYRVEEGWTYEGREYSEREKEDSGIFTEDIQPLRIL